MNVHNFPGRQPGCGGFIDISQAAKKVIFAGTFTTGGLKVHSEHSRRISLVPSRGQDGSV